MFPKKRFGPPIDICLQDEPRANKRTTDLSDSERSGRVKVKLRTIYAWVGNKRIPYERKGSLLRFRLDAILAWNEPAR